MSLSLHERARTRPWLLAAGAAGVFVLGVLTGVAIDGSRDGDWIVGKAHVGNQMMTVESDEWTYGVQGSVPLWYDTAGTQHEGGWPDCLDAPSGSNQTVRFVAQPVSVDGTSFRAVVAVDCRG